jgi:cytochrome P450
MTLETSNASNTLARSATRYLTDPTFRRDPWRFFAEVRAMSPVQADSGVWLITGYDAASEALRNDELLSRREAGLKHFVVDDPAARLIITSKMLYNDRPQHTRLRRLVSHAFTRGGIARWHDRIGEVANHTLDQMLPTGHMDLVSEYAYPVVAQIITELLGIRQGDLPEFLAWSEAMVEPPPGADVDHARAAANDATRAISAYVRERIAERRCPRRGPADQAHQGRRARRRHTRRARTRRDHHRNPPCRFRNHLQLRQQRYARPASASRSARRTDR